MFAILNGADLTPARKIVLAHSALGAHQEKKSMCMAACALSVITCDHDCVYVYVQCAQPHTHVLDMHTLPCTRVIDHDVAHVRACHANVKRNEVNAAAGGHHLAVALIVAPQASRTPSNTAGPPAPPWTPASAGSSTGIGRFHIWLDSD